MQEEKQVIDSEMGISKEDVPLLRLMEQAQHLAFVVAQDYRTRAVLLVAPTGEVLVHKDVAVFREWLRHYAQCGRYGRRCFVQGQHVCACVSGFDDWSRSLKRVKRSRRGGKQVPA